MQTQKYELYPIQQLSVARIDAFEYIANLSSPINEIRRKDIEDNLTFLNSRMID